MRGRAWEDMNQAWVSEFGALLRAYRRQAGLTQQELAAKAGLSVAALRDFEQNRRRRPRPSSLTALIDALRLDSNEAASFARAATMPGFGAEAGAALHPFQVGLGPRAVRIGAGQGLWLAILGPLEVWRDGVPLRIESPARRAVLGLLLMNPGVVMRRDTVIDMLWGESPPSTAAGLVQAHVSRLRRALGVGNGAGGDRVLSSGNGTYRLTPSTGELDLLVFRDLTTRAATARANGNDLTASELYEQALGLWRGDPLADMELLSGHPRITLLRQHLVGELLRYAEIACALGQHSRVLPRLQTLAAAEPLNEPAHARLMIALAGSGQQAAAIRVYEELRLRLDKELGLYPGRELTEAHVRILRQEVPTGDPARAHAHDSAVLTSVHMVPRQLPAAPRYFAGRAGELDALTGMLAGDTPKVSDVVIVGLTGMAGIGKTALAVYWAHQVAERFPDGQLFVDLCGFGPSGVPVTPTDAVRGFLAALGVPTAQIPVDPVHRSAMYRSLLAGRRMLIVLDNVRDAEQVRPVLPGSPGCLVLVTSRNRLTGLAAADGARLITLAVPTHGESSKLLTRHLGVRAIVEPAAVSELIMLCAQLPLALCDAAARAAVRPSLPLASLVAEMRERQGRLDALETGESATSVRMVFSWSSARLSVPAARAFALLGMHAGPDITVPAVASLAGMPQNQASVTLAELCDEHLLVEQSPGRYACHDLLRTYAAEVAYRYEGDAGVRAAVHRLLDHYLRTADTASAALYPHYAKITCGQPRSGVLPEEIAGSVQAAEWFHSERHVLLAAAKQAASEGYAPYAWQVPWVIGPFFRADKERRMLVAVQESALGIAAKLGDVAGQALARHHLGLLTFWLGEHADACEHLDKAIALAREAGDSSRCAVAGLARARAMQLQNRALEALVQVGESLRLFYAIEDRGGVIRALNALGWHLARNGDHRQAAEYRSRARATRLKLSTEFIVPPVGPTSDG